MAKKVTKAAPKKAKTTKKPAQAPKETGIDMLILSLACILVATIAIFVAFG